MRWEKYIILREKGEKWLIIFVTSGVGGLLNVLVNLSDWSLEKVSLGMKLTSVVSISLIILGFGIWLYFLRKAEKTKPTI